MTQKWPLVLFDFFPHHPYPEPRKTNPRLSNGRQDYLKLATHRLVERSSDMISIIISDFAREIAELHTLGGRSRHAIFHRAAHSEARNELCRGLHQRWKVNRLTY